VPYKKKPTSPSYPQQQSNGNFEARMSEKCKEWRDYPKDPPLVPYRKSESFNSILLISQDQDKTHFQENNAIWH
jgi:hypothetical protein